MPPVSTLYVGFFLTSLLVLFLIFCVKTPELWRSARRFLRQMKARRTRQDRMLADLAKLEAEALRLEGIYCFESVEPHVSPSCRESARERRGATAPRAESSFPANASPAR